MTFVEVIGHKIIYSILYIQCMYTVSVIVHRLCSALGLGSGRWNPGW